MDEDLFGLSDFKYYQPAGEISTPTETSTGESGLSLKGETPVEDDGFGLGDFGLYTPATGVTHGGDSYTGYPPTQAAGLGVTDLEALCRLERPVTIISRLSDPYLNLALEDYVYNTMPVRPSSGTGNCNRLMFYTNPACVVIGKNQNPYKEANVPLLRSLGIPLLRRKSGGGTVVHDQGNVNYSFMTTKDKFDRHRFGALVVERVNATDASEAGAPLFRVELNARGDIVKRGTGEKISGSAYKVSKGKSYHHGTMLLHSNLGVLKRLLHRNPLEVGVVVSASVDSVSSAVANLGMDADLFTQLVAEGFAAAYGLALVVEVLAETPLPAAVAAEAEALRSWAWKYGSSPKFTHTLTHPQHGFEVRFEVEKGFVRGFAVTASGGVSGETEGWFKYLKQVVADGDTKVPYGGSEVAGYVLDDAVSDWLGLAIDGTT